MSTEMDRLTFKVAAIECRRCGTVVWSRHTHDYRNCTCGACFIDGGRSYTRVGWEPDVGPPASLILTIEKDTLEVVASERHPEEEFIEPPRSPNDVLTDDGDPFPY